MLKFKRTIFSMLAAFAAVCASVVAAYGDGAAFSPAGAPGVTAGMTQVEKDMRVVSDIKKAISDERARMKPAIPALSPADESGNAAGEPVLKGVGGEKGAGDVKGRDGTGAAGAGDKGGAGQGDKGNAGKGEKGGAGGPGQGRQGSIIKVGKADVEIKGFRYIKYRKYGASGSENSFLSRSGLFTYGKMIEQGSSLQFKATQGERFSLGGEISEMPLQERNMVFDLKTGNYKAKLGDFTATLKGGSLASLSKKITGAEFGYETKKLKLGMVASQSKSETRTISFNGNNTHGPYDLKTFEILPGSAQVLLNGQAMDAKSYDIDYFGGQITFCGTEPPNECVNIKSSDGVQVVYEQKLLLSLKGGNIQGFSAEYKPTVNSSIGAARIIMQANRAAQRVRRTKTENFSGAQQLSFAEPQVLQLSPTSSKYLYQGQGTVFMARNTETVTRSGKPLQRNVDYTVPYDGYGAGRIALSAPPSATDSYSVSFSYFVDDFVNAQREEDIVDDGQGTNFYYLSKYTVYTGMETVLYCRGEDGRCDTQEVLQPGASKDYSFDESNNTIVIHSTKRPNTADRTFLRVSYFYVPTDSQTATNYDQSVSNIYGNYTFGKTLAISFEKASSVSDVSKTSVQVMNEILVPAGAEFTCMNTAAPPPECVRKLARENVEENSETLTFSAGGSALTRGAHYNIDPSSGLITLMGGVKVPADAALYASYRFYPAADLGLAGGNAFKLKGSGEIGRGVRYTFSRDTADPMFSPVGGNKTLETARTEYELEAPVGDLFTVTVRRSKFELAQDVYRIFSVGNTDNSYSVAYKGKKYFKKLTYEFGDSDSEDNRAPRYVDTSRKSNAMDVEFGLPAGKGEAIVKLGRSGEKFADRTGRTADTDSGKTALRVSYSPKPQLSVDFSMGSESVDATGAGESYGTRTDSRKLGINYQPNKLITLSGDVDSQRMSDSRPDSSATGVNSSAIRLTSMPFWKVRALTMSLTQQDRPSQFTGGSKNDVKNVTFTIGTSKSFAITPAFTSSKSGASSASSKTDSRNLKFEYLPPGKKIEIIMTTDTSKTSSVSESTSSSAVTRAASWDAKYKLSSNSNLIYRFNRSIGSSTGYKTSNITARNSLQYVRKAGDRLKLSAQYSTNSIRSEGSSLESKIDLSSDYKLSRFLTWNFMYNILKFTSSLQPETNYSGNLLETQLNLNF